MKKRGRKPQGLDEAVLFVRCRTDLVRRIDKVVDSERIKMPGICITRSGIVRTILMDWLAKNDLKRLDEDSQ